MKGDECGKHKQEMFIQSLWKTKTPEERKDGEGHLCLPVFVARNRDLFSLTQGRKGAVLSLQEE